MLSHKPEANPPELMNLLCELLYISIKKFIYEYSKLILYTAPSHVGKILVGRGAGPSDSMLVTALPSDH